MIYVYAEWRSCNLHVLNGSHNKLVYPFYWKNKKENASLQCPILDELTFWRLVYIFFTCSLGTELIQDQTSSEIANMSTLAQYQHCLKNLTNLILTWSFDLHTMRFRQSYWIIAKPQTKLSRKSEDFKYYEACFNQRESSIQISSSPEWSETASCTDYTEEILVLEWHHLHSLLMKNVCTIKHRIAWWDSNSK